MKATPEKSNTVFENWDILNEVSPNYRFMHSDETNSIKEFYKGVRFSRSEKHRSGDYINYSCYKPFSLINYSLFLKQNERK